MVLAIFNQILGSLNYLLHKNIQFILELWSFKCPQYFLCRLFQRIRPSHQDKLKIYVNYLIFN